MEYIDYGSYEIIEIGSLHRLPNKYYGYPRKCRHVGIRNIKGDPRKKENMQGFEFNDLFHQALRKRLTTVVIRVQVVFVVRILFMLSFTSVKSYSKCYIFNFCRIRKFLNIIKCKLMYSVKINGWIYLLFIKIFAKLVVCFHLKNFLNLEVEIATLID